jgi:hypothetical protein
MVGPTILYKPVRMPGMFAGGVMPGTLWKAVQRVRDVLFYGKTRKG